MKPLNAYVKPSAPAAQTVTTSVTLTRTQHDFVKRRNLNLSALLRDWLDDLIKRTEK